MTFARAIAALAGLAAIAAACSTQQPKPACPVARHTWWAVYTLKPGEATAGACAQKSREMLGVYKYNPAKVTGEVVKPDPSSATIAIASETLGNLAASSAGEGRPDTNMAHSPVSLGAFPVEPDADNFCTAATLSVATQDIPVLPAQPLEDGGTDPEKPAVNISYAWSNVKVTSLVNAPGTQLVADLAYTEGGCTSKYTVTALSPMVSCKDADGGADVSLCVKGGIGPDFALVCDPTSLMCELAKPVPSLVSP